ncbi:MAG: HAMP domain-containing sensor histidine kinase [Clostridia bacterium]
MKLWQKISIVCTAVLLAVVALTSGLLLIYARNNILSLTIANTKEKQSSLAKSFASMAGYTLSDNMNAEEQQDELLACFGTFADETGVLVHGYESLYTFVDMEPQDILFLTTSDQRVFLDELGSRNLLVVGSLVPIPNVTDSYAVYIVRDITYVYKTFQTMVIQFIVAAIFCILLGTVLIVFLVRAASRPLKILSTSAKSIADGEYEERADVHTNDEIGALADDFNRMAEAVQTHIRVLQERNALQEQFIGGLTHEFKTPMTSMMLHSETLLTMRLTAEQQEKSLQHIHTQCQWLERLTQKLMALVSLGENLHPMERSVSALFEHVQESTAETLEKRQTSLSVECKIDTLPMDVDLMQSLLINLVDNASKASQPGQTIELCAKGRTLSVTDHGHGIPADAISRVTEPFYMVDKSRSKKLGGSGLGLALVKRIADAHGAALTIDSILGEGTTICITFP